MLARPSAHIFALPINMCDQKIQVLNPVKTINPSIFNSNQDNIWIGKHFTIINKYVSIEILSQLMSMTTSLATIAPVNSANEAFPLPMK